MERPTLPPLPPDAQDERRPPTPDEIVNALQDRVPVEAGQSRPAKAARVPGSCAQSWADYRAAPGINWSLLKELAHSPARLRCRADHPREDTPALALGRAVDVAILEPYLFARDWAVWPGGRRAGPEWAAWLAARAEDGQETLSGDEHERVVGMACAVHMHPAAHELLSEGQAQVTVEWPDAVSGLRCKGRIDWLASRRGDQAPMIVDVKSTRDGSPRAFAADAARYQYHGQLAFYQRGMHAICGEWLDCAWIVVEKDPPHDVAVYRVSPIDLAAGHRLVDRYLAQYAECWASGVWPGRSSGMESLRLPAWAYGGDDLLSAEEDL